MRAKLQVLPRTGVIVRVHHTRLYHASPIVHRTNLRDGQIVPNPFAPKPTPTERPLPNIYGVVDRRATGSSDSGETGEQRRFSKEDVSDWLQKKAGRLLPLTDRTFPLEGVKDISNVAEFEALAGDGKAGAPEAMLFLARSRMKLEHLPLEEQRSAAAAAGASRILAWILQTDRRYWDTILPSDFIDLLCWHIEAEDKSHVLIEWLATFTTLADMQRGAIKAHNPLRRIKLIRWPTLMLARIIRAKIYWGEGNSATAAMECIFSLRDRGCTQAFDVLDTTAATIEVRGALLRDETPPCSPRLFDEYVKWEHGDRFTRQPQTRAAMEWYRATIAPYHPTEASPHPILQACQAEDYVEQTIRGPDRLRQNMANNLLRAAYLLRLESNDSAAQILENTSQRLHPKPWSRLRMLYHSWRDDPKLRDHHSRSVHGKSLRPY
ncbi:hypothetical protein CBER1_11730 [Cercospora berteroae]|uniref:Uncharacterized protein n=1 Tax=Cercospora berteroae TaxID=357750 RepID=A0A2S6BZW9_9PEZI|nr:hypothetical protein CBER1_11730 [Cercospora berteroae]